MALDLTGKTALVTGGTSGIGLAVAHRFAAHGARVVISGRRGNGDEVAAGFGGTFVPVDLTGENGAEQLFATVLGQCDQLDIVVNNAGRSKVPEPVADQPLADFDAVLDINLRAAYRVLQQAARHVAPGGSIINTASIAAIDASPGASAYFTSKAALVQLTRVVSLELADRAIRVNSVSPGLIYSEIWGDRDPQDLARHLVPLGRVGQADEAAAVYHFLAADESSYVTGANFVVDGGYTAGKPKQLAEALSHAPKPG